jgi:hypothetical protein
MSVAFFDLASKFFLIRLVNYFIELLSVSNYEVQFNQFLLSFSSLIGFVFTHLTVIGINHPI